VLQLWQELRVFLAQQGYPISTNFQGNFWLYLNVNSLSWIVQPFTFEKIDLGFSHVAATTQKTAGHATRNIKINESQSSCSIKFVQHPVWITKGNHLIYCDCSRWISSVSCEKCGFNTVSRVFFKRPTSLNEFVFSFYFYKSRKSLLVKIGRWLAIKNVNRLLGEISVFGNAEKWYAKICWQNDIYIIKIAYIWHIYSTKF